MKLYSARIFSLTAKFRILYIALLVFMTAGLNQPVQAAFDPVNDDTDIFLANPNNPAERPNILLVLDNTANWSRNVDSQAIVINELAALRTVVDNLSDQFNLGIMMFPETGAPNDSIDGGVVRYHIRQMIPENKTVLSALVGGMENNADKSNNNVLSQVMVEAFRYFSGKTNIASFGKIKADYASNAAHPATAAGLTSNALPSSPTASSLYNSPITPANACASNFIIFISNGDASENAASLSISQAELTSVLGSSPSIIPLSPSNRQGNWADEWAAYLANADIKDGASVNTYVVEVDPQTTGNNPDHTALMKSMAKQGKGKYFSVTSANGGQSIVNALNQIFSEIQAVNSVFASTTLPVSVNVRGTNLNQVYIGVFRPDEFKAPRWFGNLKAYQLGFDQNTSTLFLADKNGNPAENPQTGFINPNAHSFWTQNSSFWAFRQTTEPEKNGVGGASDAPDGDLVEKGGSAQQQRESISVRNLYTCTTGGSNPCISGDSLADTPFATSNDGITGATLSLGTLPVTTLTALDTQTITQLSDTRAVETLTTAPGGVPLTNLTHNATTFSVSSLSTATAKAITALSNNPINKSISDLSRSTGSCKNIITATVNSHGFSTGQVVHISGAAAAEYNGSYTITVVDANKFTYDIGNCNPAANAGGTPVATTTSTVVTATVNSHGFATGNSVSIAGVSPGSFNGTYTINKINDNSFSFVTSSALPPVSSIAGATATGLNSTIATATTAVAHGFILGQQVTITGATPTAYNGTFIITSIGVPTPNSFTYDVGSSLTSASGTITASGGGGTTATATLPGHGFTPGVTVATITGAVPSGYNGSFTVTGVFGDDFTYTTAVPLPPATGTPMVAIGTSPIATATIPGHGFGVAPGTVNITIAGVANFPAAYNGNVTATIVDENTVTYPTVDGSSPESATGTITARLTSPTAIATVTGHGLDTGNVVTISGADQAGYNRTDIAITKIDDDTFHYPLAATIGTDATTAGTITVSQKTTTARARVATHGLSDGDSVTIAGATPTAFNGTFTVSVLPGDTNNFTYTLASPQGDATGTIVADTGTTSIPDDLINWVRGIDNFEDENANGISTDMRASIHGDVLHSRPAVVNYNRHDNDNDVYIFYGANDGVFRGVKGGFEQSSVGEPLPGNEAWGFIPEEFFGRLNRLRNNEPRISSSNKKPYFADGSIGVFVNDTNNDGKLVAADGDKVFLFISMHRGGRLIYALDVSDPTNPKFLWKRSNVDWPELGQTWSVPQVVTIAASANPVLIFGAGYDPLVEDVPPDTITATSATAVTAGAAVYTRSMGRGMFVVDAVTGNILLQTGPSGSDSGLPSYKVVSGMDCAIPSDLAVITDRSGGIDNRAYAGDTCGNVWRLDLASPVIGDDITDTNITISVLQNSTVTKLASIAGSAPAGLRKFLFPPDVVFDNQSVPNFDAVLIGSGDREHPFDEVVVNRMYMFRDYGIGTSPDIQSINIQESELFDATTNCLQDANACLGTGDETDQTTAATALDNGKGWFITLGTGEKLVGNAVTLNNITFFNTNQPSTAVPLTCTSDLGIARQYQVFYNNATAFQDQNLDGSLTAADRSTIHPGGGYLPSPVPVVVEIDGNIYEGVISGVRVEQPPGSALGARLRKFWFKEFE